MIKKVPAMLLIPALSLFPLAHSFAASSVHPPVNPPRPDTPPHTSLHQLVLRGHLLNATTLQVNQSDLAKLPSQDQYRVITTTDAQGHKERFVLLTPARSQLAQALLDYHGSLKEFDLYSVVDETGKNTHLIASKRTLTAPANQLTLQFDSAEDAKACLTPARLQSLANANIYVLVGESASLSTQAQASIIQAEIKADQAANQIYINNLEKQINAITEQAQITAHDSSKSSIIIEPVQDFPMKAVLLPVIVAAPKG